MEDTERKKTMIAARERGPGPGRYGLPSTVGFKGHDFTKHQKPSYSFGMRLDNSMFSKDVSPGPKYLIESRYTRHGPEGEPKYSMLARQPELRGFKTPGPGTYDNQRVHPQGERHAPKYSMSMRTRFRKRDANPAPNAYSLPQLVGPKVINKNASSAYSMTGRSKINGFDEDLARTPGPAKYDVTSPNVSRTKQPLYSMLGRNEMPGDNTRKPGPGAHSPEKVYINKTRAPACSIGIRHSEFITPLIIDVLD
uniref:outer dense fiber protein 3-like n=1 Tax=Styela clava TaxID=7725 RepID=UPI001939BF64|nr:outer dense fiber protein 3-like [Styela clava]